MIDVMDSKPLQGCKLSFKGIAQGRMKNNHSLACLGAIEAGPQDTEQLFNDWVSEVETFDERLFWQKKMYRWTGEEVGPSWSPSCPFRQRGWIKTQNRKIWKMCNPRAGLHCASSLDSHYQIAHIQGDEINVIFFRCWKKSPYSQSEWCGLDCKHGLFLDKKNPW